MKMFRRSRSVSSALTVPVVKKRSAVNLTFFTSGWWFSVHAISMQTVFINFGKSSKSWASVPTTLSRQTVWLRALTATWASTIQPGQCGFVYVSSGYHGPRVSQHNVIGVDTDADQSAWELSQAPIFLVSMFVLRYALCVASHMDIIRDVVEGKPT